MRFMVYNVCKFYYNSSKMERDRLKTLFWPLGRNSFSNYYRNFERRAQGLGRADIESQLVAPAYTHQLREAVVRTGVGMALVIGLAKAVESLTEPASTARILHLLSLGSQWLAAIIPSATRGFMIQTEQKILQAELERRQAQLN